MKRISLLFFVIVYSVQMSAQTNIIDSLFQNKTYIHKEMKDALDKYEIQVIYTQIDRDENNFPRFTTHKYGLKPNDYFYPASTVKMPTAIMALEKLNEMQVIGLDKNTRMKTGIGSIPQTAAETDSTAQNSFPSIAHYIKKIFLVSDNDAYNRLYEFLGQEYLNRRLHEKGFQDTRIIHRLSASKFDRETNKLTNPVSFFDKNEELLYYQGEVKSSFDETFPLKKLQRGKARMTDDGEIIKESFDFSEKNFIALTDLHEMMKTIIFPETKERNQRFNLLEEDYQFLYRNMSKLPRESDFPSYDKPDNYVKFWMFGHQMSEAKIPDYFHVYNKVGFAYGFLTDVAYIIDSENGVEFLVTAILHVNENETYNDGEYEYDSIGFRFLGELGQAIYIHELDRKKAHLPDFSRFLEE